MKILLTGATSFTGCYIAEALAPAKVTACLFADEMALAGKDVLAQRTSFLKSLSHVSCETYQGFETPSMCDLIEKHCPDVLVSHGTWMKDYRSFDYDVGRAVGVSALPLPKLLPLFKKCGGKLFVHTGSVFEPREGEGDGLDHGFSPYGVSKAMVYDLTRFYCRHFGVPLLKMVIPNPIGPMENDDRLIPVFVKKWRAGEKALLTTPSLVRDNIPVRWLAQCYAKNIQRLVETSVPETIFRPQGLVQTMQEFVVMVALELGVRLHLDAAYDVRAQVVNQPQKRINTDSAIAFLGLRADDELRRFWEDLASYYAR